jgi:hypothetical protein
MNFFVLLLLATILTEAITEIVTKSEISNIFKSRLFSLGKKNKFFNFLHNLFDCGYCFSVWAGWLVAILFFRDLNFIHWSLDWFFIGLLLHRLSNLFHNIMDRVHGKVI